MGEPIYVIDPKTQAPKGIEPVSFNEINIKERSDLEQWIIKHSNILGEKLLIITSEFSGFDKSKRRPDILALDKDGVLTVVELKLDISGTLADQQAIRYAAFLAEATMRDVVGMLAKHRSTSEDEAEKLILDFLDMDELPDLDRPPKIILAAGSMDDQELTACVLWLRKFGLDITCVELTPYRLPDSGQIILTPRTIIPLPETRDYLIQVERKEIERVSEQKARSATESLWRAVGDEFNKLGNRFSTTGKAKGNYMQVPIGRNAIHYEWMLRKRDDCLDVALHFEDDDEALNREVLKPFEAKREEIEKGIGQPVITGNFGKKWTQVRCWLTYDGSQSTGEIAPQAAELMRKFINQTWPLVERLPKARPS